MVEIQWLGEGGTDGVVWLWEGNGYQFPASIHVHCKTALQLTSWLTSVCATVWQTLTKG